MLGCVGIPWDGLLAGKSWRSYLTLLLVVKISVLQNLGWFHPSATWGYCITVCQGMPCKRGWHILLEASIFISIGESECPLLPFTINPWTLNWHKTEADSSSRVQVWGGTLCDLCDLFHHVPLRCLVMTVEAEAWSGLGTHLSYEAIPPSQSQPPPWWPLRIGSCGA